mgnify:CR=1 FL=1
MKFFISICYFHLLIRFYVYTRKIQFLCILHTSLMYSCPLYLMLIITCHNSSKQDPLTQKNPTPTKKDHQKAAPQSKLNPIPHSLLHRFLIQILRNNNIYHCQTNRFENSNLFIAFAACFFPAYNLTKFGVDVASFE